MPFYRWEDYQCTNVGHCRRADRHDIIDLPRGAEAICPGCGKPVIPLRAREIVLVSPPLAARSRPRRRRVLWPLAAVGLLVLGLTGGTVSLLMRPPEVRSPERLYLAVPAEVTARVGDVLEVPLTVGPASPADLVLSVAGNLPAGVSLDVAGRRLHGTVQSPGASAILLTARAPHYASASAEMSITVRPNLAPAAVLSLHVPPEIEGRVGEPLEVALSVDPVTNPDPILTIIGKLPAGVSLDGTGKRVFGVPRGAGSYGVILKATVPDYTPAFAEVTFTILEAKPSPPPAGNENAVANNTFVAKGNPDGFMADPPGTPASVRVQRRGSSPEPRNRGSALKNPGFGDAAAVTRRTGP